MKSFKQITQGNSLMFYEYVAKCLVGVTVGYLLMRAFPRESGQYYWVLISVVLSITHDNNSKVALDRMRGNIVGSVVGLFVFFLHNPPILLTICIGVIMIITLCFALRSHRGMPYRPGWIHHRDPVRRRSQQLGGSDLPHDRRCRGLFAWTRHQLHLPENHLSSVAEVRSRRRGRGRRSRMRTPAGKASPRLP